MTQIKISTISKQCGTAIKKIPTLKKKKQNKTKCLNLEQNQGTMKCVQWFCFKYINIPFKLGSTA